MIRPILVVAVLCGATIDLWFSWPRSRSHPERGSQPEYHAPCTAKRLSTGDAKRLSIGARISIVPRTLAMSSPPLTVEMMVSPPSELLDDPVFVV
jgi:hypothetical protein